MSQATLNTNNSASNPALFKPRYRVYSQEFHGQGEKTVLGIYQADKNTYVKMTAHEIFYQDTLLENFSISDIRLIALLVAKEQILSDMAALDAFKAKMPIS